MSGPRRGYPFDMNFFGKSGRTIAAGIGALTLGTLGRLRPARHLTAPSAGS